MTLNQHPQSLVERARQLENIDIDQALDLWRQVLTIIDDQPQCLTALPTAQWLTEAYRLSLRPIGNLVTDNIEQIDHAIATTYDRDSAHSLDKLKQAVSVGQIQLFHRRWSLARVTTDQKPPLELSIVRLFFYVVGAVIALGDHKLCLKLCQQCTAFIDAADTSTWQAHLNSSQRTGLANLRFDMNYQASLACRNLTQFTLALEYIDKCNKQLTDFEDLLSAEVLLPSLLLLKADIQIKSNQAPAASNTLDLLNGLPHLTKDILFQAELAAQMLQFTITGDYVYLYRRLFCSLLPPELDELIKLHRQQIQQGSATNLQLRSLELKKLAFSEERLQSLFERCQDKSFIQELREYGQYCFNDNDTLSKSSFEPYLQKLAHLTNTRHWAELPNALCQTGIYLTLDSHPEKNHRWDDIAYYLKTIMQSNQLAVIVEQLQYVNYLLSVCSLAMLRQGETQLTLFTRQIIRLANHWQNDTTPEQQRHFNAMNKERIDSFLVTLAEFAIKLTNNQRFWLRAISQLKCFFDFNGLNAHLQLQLYRIKDQLDDVSLEKVNRLTEQLACRPLTLKRKKAMDQAQYALQSELLLLRKRKTQPQLGSTIPRGYELIILDPANGSSNDQYCSIFTLYANKKRWTRPVVHQQMSQTQILNTIDQLSKVDPPTPIALLHQNGRKFAELLLNKPLVIDAPLCLGVRSTGILQGLPLEALSISFGWFHRQRFRWFGQITVTALLTGSSDKLDCVINPISFNQLTIFADPCLASDLDSLKGSAEETTNIIAAVKPTVQVALFEQQKANRQQFLALSGRQAPQVLHILTHGISHPDKSELSCLALSQIDEFGNPMTPAIGFYDICLMDLTRTELVVLSACSTHHGRSVQGESVTSIAWAFKAAGVSAVIGTRWPVHDQASGLFWHTFYQKLATGHSIAGALREARISLINSTQWYHPVYWAAYQLIV